MPLVVLSFKIEDGVTTNLTKRQLATAARVSHRFAGEYWLEVIMPRHFHGATQARYQLEPRNDIYLRIIKPLVGRGAGKFALLQKTGASFRFAQFFSRISATQHQAVVRVNVPGYFANPRIGTVYEGGERKVVTRQPDKSRELTDSPQSDVRELDMRATEIYAAHFDPSTTIRNIHVSRSRRVVSIT